MVGSNKAPKRNVTSKKRSLKQKNNARRKSKRSDIKINLPFPPDINLEKFFPSKYNVSLRTLNAFIIYRKVVTAEIKKNYTLCWSKISEIASDKWYHEDDKVKQHYRELAERVKALYRSEHLFYVPHGRNAIGSIMFQDNNETTEQPPKTFIFVSSEYENLNDSNRVVEQQNVFDEQIEDDIEMPDNFNNVDSHILLNENEQIISPDNTMLSLESQRNIIGFNDFTTLLHYNGDEMIHSIVNEFSFPLEMENNNI